jgi:hypothetical protein
MNFFMTTSSTNLEPTQLTEPVFLNLTFKRRTFEMVVAWAGRSLFKCPFNLATEQGTPNKIFIYEAKKLDHEYE